MTHEKLKEIETIFNSAFKKPRRYNLTIVDGRVRFDGIVTISRQKQNYLKDLLRAGTTEGQRIVLLDTANIRLP